MAQYSKAWTALTMSVLAIISLYLGWESGLSEETVTAMITGIIALLTPLLVWLVPNRP